MIVLWRIIQPQVAIFVEIPTVCCEAVLTDQQVVFDEDVMSDVAGSVRADAEYAHETLAVDGEVFDGKVTGVANLYRVAAPRSGGNDGGGTGDPDR